MTPLASAKTLFGVTVYRWVLLGALMVLLLVLSIVIRGQLDIEWSMDSLRLFVQSLGVWGPMSYICILVFRFLFLIPSSLLLLAAGILFGPLYGALYAGLGLFGSALWKYAMVCIVGQNILLRQLPESLQPRLATTVKRKSSVWALAGISAYPFIPKHMFQFAAILSGMALPAYASAVFTGSFIRAGLFASAGEALYSGMGLVAVTAALVILLGAPLCIAPWRRWILAPLHASFTHKFQE